MPMSATGNEHRHSFRDFSRIECCGHSPLHNLIVQFLLSPWFIGLSIASLLIMGMELWGLMRACRKHKRSPLGALCDKEDCFPSTGMIIAAIFYILLTFAYIVLPPILHDLL